MSGPRGGLGARARVLWSRKRNGRRDNSSPQHDGPLFDAPYYVDHTAARLAHLDAMGLPLKGRRVLDLGCGVGRFSEYFRAQNCDLLCADGREENINLLRENYPGQPALVVDVESDDLLSLGTFEVVFCYGLLYHLVDPFGFLQKIGSVCEDLVILETRIMDDDRPLNQLVAEYDDPTMGLRRVASRPTSSFIAISLRLAGFDYVYSPTTMPDHGDFQFRRRNDGADRRDGNDLRDIFVASRHALTTDSLRLLDASI